MIASIPSAVLLGVDGRPVRVEVHVANGLPGLHRRRPARRRRAGVPRPGPGRLASRAACRGPGVGSPSTWPRRACARVVPASTSPSPSGCWSPRACSPPTRSPGTPSWASSGLDGSAARRTGCPGAGGGARRPPAGGGRGERGGGRPGRWVLPDRPHAGRGGGPVHRSAALAPAGATRSAEPGRADGGRPRRPRRRPGPAGGPAGARGGGHRRAPPVDGGPAGRRQDPAGQPAAGPAARPRRRDVAGGHPHPLGGRRPGGHDRGC